jgi:ankyrin repeat protein
MHDGLRERFPLEIWDAATNDDVGQAQTLIEGAKNVDVVGIDGLTALHWVCGVRESPQVVMIVEMLIARGANVHAFTDTGWTPLHYAALHENPTIVTRLLSHGANPDVKSKNGRTPRGIAIETRNERLMAVFDASGG